MRRRRGQCRASVAALFSYHRSTLFALRFAPHNDMPCVGTPPCGAVVGSAREGRLRRARFRPPPGSAVCAFAMPRPPFRARYRVCSLPSHEVARSAGG